MKKSQMRLALRLAQKQQRDNVDRTISIHNTYWVDDEGERHHCIMVGVMIDDLRGATIHADRYETAADFESAIIEKLKEL